MARIAGANWILSATRTGAVAVFLWLISFFHGLGTPTANSSAMHKYGQRRLTVEDAACLGEQHSGNQKRKP